MLRPKVGDPEWRKSLAIKVISDDVACVILLACTHCYHFRTLFARTTLKTDECIIQAGVCQQRCDVTRRSVGDQGLFRLERIYADFILGIDANQFIAAELDEFRRGFPWKCEDNRHPSLAEDIDLTAPKLSITCSHRKQGLNGIVRERADLRVNATSRELYIIKVISQ